MVGIYTYILVNEKKWSGLDLILLIQNAYISQSMNRSERIVSSTYFSDQAANNDNNQAITKSVVTAKASFQSHARVDNCQ